RTMGYLHQQRGEQSQADEHYREAYELVKAQVSQLKNGSPANLTAEQLHSAIAELRASSLKVAPVEWESLLTVLIETYSQKPDKESEARPSDAEVVLVNLIFDQLINIRRQRGDVTAGIASLKAAMAYADARLSERPGYGPFKARQSELHRIFARELPRIAAHLLKTGNVDQAKYIYDEMTKSFLAEDGTWDANLLNESSWYVALEKQQPVDAYAQALAWAERAAEASPETGSILNTLGVAQYRAGHFKESLETLERSAKLNSKLSGVLIPADVAFIAMAHHQLGHHDEACKHLETLRDLLTWDQWKNDSQNQRFLQEAKELITKAAPSVP
ncbi:MAG: hypothetical protein KDA52_22335, partial [Planctomycetaceae bacterium]|nr:hypothetical protein [Planctomycetaceae bacterium]